jgi:monofunctional glycosyltransferase
MQPRMSRSKRPQAWRLARIVALALLLGPAAVLLVFRFVPVPITSLMLIRLAEGYPLHHDWVPYRRIAPALPRAVIASEDNRFCSEPLGIDGGALWSQVDDWLHGRRPRGASTITMQVARNLFLWPAHSMVRKVLELWLTPQVAILWPKRRILDVYLNSVEFGPGIFGAQAAARHWFGRNAAALTPDQAARLAVILPDPLHWSPLPPDPWAAERALLILNRVQQLGPLDDCAR